MTVRGLKLALLGGTVLAGLATSATAQGTAPAPSAEQPSQTTTGPVPPDPAVVQPNADDSAQVTPSAPGDPTTALPTQPVGTDDGSEVETVVITGSRIRRDPTNAPTPLIQINRQELLETGQPNIVDFLADVPQLAGSTVPEDTTGTSLGTGGLSLLNLRFLGAARTLVLVDGRRHVGSAYFASSAVDVDTIPRLLIQSTELITGAASSIYGADAVSGVVNFVLRRDFDGVEIDASVGQLNKEGDSLTRRVSALVGRNFLNDRLNLYAHLEYEKTDETFNTDIGFLRDGCALIQTDLDPLPSTATPASALSDGVIDGDVRCNLQSVNLPVGGSLTLANLPQPSPLNDPDLPFLAAGVCNAPARNALPDIRCFNANPGLTFLFRPDGQVSPVDFGTFRTPASGTGARTLVQGSSNARPLIDTDNDVRTPASEAFRVQLGANLDVTSWLQAFGEYKSVREETGFTSTTIAPQVTIRPFAANEVTELTGTQTFTIGLDNAYLDPTVRTLIQSNRRTVYAAPTMTGPGAPTTTVPDPRALFRGYLKDLFTRQQENVRDTNRYVVGLRGDFEQVSFLKDIAYEVAYTYGEVEDNNLEPRAFDTERYAFAADAVVDTAGRVNGRPNEIVCRVQLLAAQGVAIPRYVDIRDNVASASRRRYARTDEAIAGCRPINIFGDEGSRITSEQSNYLFTFQERGFRITQKDLSGFVSANLWDFWGAGPIGIALGFEKREDTFSNDIGNAGDRFDRLLFSNIYVATPERGTGVSERFGEIRLPLLRDLPFAENVEISGSFRRSDYDISGQADTYSLQGFWRFSKDFAIRATTGKAIREPSLNQLFRSAAQTFVGISDNCSADIIGNTADTALRERRLRNCAAQGIPTTFQDPVDGTDPGQNGSNPNLTPEEGLSYTYSVLLTPRFIPNFSLVIDVYDIQLKQAIESLGINDIVDLCYDGETLNELACAAFQRNPTTFEITNFFQGPLNFAGVRNRGIDFNARYRIDLADLVQRELGELTLAVRGNYLLRDQSFTNPADPGDATDFDGEIGEPRVRFRVTTDYKINRFGVTWAFDYFTSQEVSDSNALILDPDVRPVNLLDTGSFAQNDFTLRYELTDKIRFRAGVTNAFDAEPPLSAQVSGVDLDLFDLFGRRFFVGVNVRR